MTHTRDGRLLLDVAQGSHEEPRRLERILAASLGTAPQLTQWFGVWLVMTGALSCFFLWLDFWSLKGDKDQAFKLATASPDVKLVVKVPRAGRPWK